MNSREPQRVTRTYARGLVAAVAVLAVAILVASWGLVALWLEVSPVSSTVPNMAAPLIIFAALIVLIAALWHQVLEILRGHRPGWALLVIVPGLAYLIWCVGGVLVGMSVQETWLSPFAFILAVVWALALLIFWGVFLRKVYTDRGTPQWPWEKHSDDDEIE